MIVVWLFAGMLIIDGPFGLGLGPWDQVPKSVEESRALFKQFNSVNSSENFCALEFCTPEMVPMVKAVFRENGANEDMMTAVWHKTDHNPIGNKRSLVSACEFMVIAFFGPQKKRFWNCNKNPKLRHNFFEFPNAVKTRITGTTESVSPCYKSHQLVGHLVDMLCDPKKIVVDLFSGGLGASLGASLVAARTVVGVEIDAVTQRNAVLGAKALAQDVQMALEKKLNIMGVAEEVVREGRPHALALEHKAFNEQGQCIDGDGGAAASGVLFSGENVQESQVLPQMKVVVEKEIVCKGCSKGGLVEGELVVCGACTHKWHKECAKELEQYGEEFFCDAACVEGYKKENEMEEIES